MNELLWPGIWYTKAAEILRADLEEATIAMKKADPKAEGIPYFVEGPDGPLYADFHGSGIRTSRYSTRAERSQGSNAAWPGIPTHA